MAKVLVVYYSRTGNTRSVAERLARALDASICPIEEAGSRLGCLGYLRSLWQALFLKDERATLKPLACDPTRFDLVVVGTPVWAWDAAAPAKAFAHLYREQLKRAAFFCTMGGSGAENALATLQRALGIAPVATMAVTAAEIERNGADAKLHAFVGALKHAARDRTRALAVTHKLRAAAT